MNTVYLSNENRCNCFIKSRSIHINCTSDWQYKSRDSRVNANIFFQASESNWQRKVLFSLVNKEA